MTIPFAQIPSDQMIGLFSAEFSEAEPEQVAVGARLPILEGQKLPAAPAVAGTRYLITSKGEGATWFGRGSPLHRMIVAFFNTYPAGKCYAAAQTDAGGATAASVVVDFTGPATESGTLRFRIGGQEVPVAVASGDANTAIATAFAAAITALEDLCVSASVDTTAVTITCKVKGTVGNQVGVSLNALGQAGGEETPAGVGVTVSATPLTELQLSGGAGDPTSSAWVTALGGLPWSLIGLQFPDATAVDDLQTELAARWDASSSADGVLVVTKADSKTDLLTYCATLNDWRILAAGVPEASGYLSPAFEITGAIVGVLQRVCVSSNLPVANEQRTPLTGIWGGGTDFSETDRNMLAVGGCATIVSENGTAYIEFAASTRRLTDHGDLETRYQDIQVAFSMSWLRQYYRSAVARAFPRHNIAKDGTFIPGGAKVITPTGLRVWTLDKYRALEGIVVHDVSTFDENLIVDENATNPNRLDAKIEPTFLPRFRVMGMSIVVR